MRELNDIMDFDHVIRVLPDGSVSEAVPNVYAPEVYNEVDASGQCLADADAHMIADLSRAGWSIMDGYSGQYGYAGPVMHESEFIGGGMERDILATPGLYVACPVYPLGGPDEPEPVVAYREDVDR